MKRNLGGVTAPKPKAGIKVTVAPMSHYEVEDAARTIARAEEHKANPKMMKAVRAHAARLGAAVGAKKGRGC